MNWDNVRNRYFSKFESMEKVVDGIDKIFNENLSPELKSYSNDFDTFKSDFERVHNSLKQKEFRVVISGLEKAGKSVLTNALLGEDILPYADERCTLAACEIKSVKLEQDQRYEIEYLTEIEKNNLINDFETIAKNDPKAGMTLAMYRSNERNMEQFLRKGKETVKFSKLADVKNDLQNAIYKNKPQALSIKSLIIYTNSISNLEDISYVDIPGFDSPEAQHLDMAKKAFADSDAVIFARPINRPSITDPEIKLLNINDSEDASLRIGDKIFVVPTKLDSLGSKENFEENIKKVRDEWRSYNVPEERIIPVSAAYKLLRSGVCEDPNLRAQEQRIQESLRKIQGDNIDDGIDKLKDSVKNYVENERGIVLEKRCTKIVHKFESFFNEFSKKLLIEYPSDSSLMKQNDAENGTYFSNTWEQVWPDFLSCYNEHYIKDVETIKSGKDETFKSTKDDFTKLVEHHIRDNKLTNDEIRPTYKTSSTKAQAVEFASDGNTNVRNKYKELYRQALYELTSKYTTKFWERMEQHIKGIVDFWGGIDSVEAIFYKKADFNDKSELEQNLRISITTLIIKYARPLVELFIERPRGSRDEYIKAYSEGNAFLQTIPLHYKAGSGIKDDPKSNIIEYLTIGKWEKSKGRNLSGEDALQEQFKYSLKTEDECYSIKPNATPIAKPTSFEEVVKEINEDIDAFADYVSIAVYKAASAEEFFLQELDKIKHSIEVENIPGNIKTQVREAVLRAWMDGKAGKLFKQPYKTDYQDKMRICNIVSNLEKSYKNYREKSC